MGWGDVPAWTAIALSVAAGSHSLWTARQAKQERAGAASVEVSLQRIADNMSRERAEDDTGYARLLEMLRSGRIMMSTPRMGRSSAPEFNTEFVKGQTYRLRNVGTAPASNVRVSVGDHPAGLTRNLPQGVDLPPLASSDPFLIAGAMGHPIPGEVLVSCDELAEPVAVPLPARG